MEKTGVIIYGCGIMGRKITQALLDKETFRIVGAIDSSPALAGKDLGEILDPPVALGVKITPNAEELLSTTDAKAVVLATTSFLSTLLDQIEKCINTGLHVISTCEELAYPWKRSPVLAKRIDDLAKNSGVTVVGTGINPGYLMDTLPLALTAPCLKVNSINVVRMMDSAKRRIPFQKKIGTGLSVEEFSKQISEKKISGHVGLQESIHMIADGIGWDLDTVKEEPPKAIVASADIATPLGLVPEGRVIGLVSTAVGILKGKEVITLEFNANASNKEEYDEIVIEGVPDIHQKIMGGVHGDIGTVAVTINTIPRAIQANPGLYLMKDLPPAIVTR